MDKERLRKMNMEQLIEAEEDIQEQIYKIKQAYKKAADIEARELSAVLNYIHLCMQQLALRPL